MEVYFWFIFIVLKLDEFWKNLVKILIYFFYYAEEADELIL